MVLSVSHPAVSLSELNGRWDMSVIPAGSLKDPVGGGGGGGGAVWTVRAALPLFPSLTAVMVVLPLAMAVINPNAEIVATALLLELQVIMRPVSTLLAESYVLAVA
jgi:hypothetical protein